MDETQRLFIAIDLPPEVKALLRQLQTQLSRHTTAVRWADPQGTHLTLKFLGSTPVATIDAVVAGLRQAAAAHHPLTLSTERLGVFPNARRPRVVWLGVTGMIDALGRLRDDVERLIAPLGFPTEDRPFSPHLTLGRTVKEPSAAQLATVAQAVAQTAAPAPIAFDVAELVLMRSELRPGGAKYTPVVHAPLGTPA